jgi:hypothetical protein
VKRELDRGLSELLRVSGVENWNIRIFSGGWSLEVGAFSATADNEVNKPAFDVD